LWEFKPKEGSIPKLSFNFDLETQMTYWMFNKFQTILPTNDV